TSPDHLVRTAFDTSGTINGHFGEDWWDEWKAIVPTGGGSAGGYSLRYVELVLNDGSNVLRLTLPVRLDMPQIAPADRALDASLSFIAAGDDTDGTGGAPTVPTIKVENV
ncbi:MAG TPA: hypothetical protein VFH61_17960, partial [Thermoleophilia bacterium]|nr:hypothetical protein [Thermoleophilia bacterium]